MLSHEHLNFMWGRTLITYKILGKTIDKRHAIKLYA